MITEPDWNRVRIAVEKKIAWHSYEHAVENISSRNLPGIAKAALLAVQAQVIAYEHMAQVTAIRHGHHRPPQGEVVQIQRGRPTGEVREVVEAMKHQMPPNVTIH